MMGAVPSPPVMLPAPDPPHTIGMPLPVIIADRFYTGNIPDLWILRPFRLDRFFARAPEADHEDLFS
jgi:hypothetical protein